MRPSAKYRLTAVPGHPMSTIFNTNGIRNFLLVVDGRPKCGRSSHRFEDMGDYVNLCRFIML